MRGTPVAEIPPNVQQLVKRVTGGIEKTPLGKRWAQVKTAGKIITAVYYANEVVRNEDGSINRVLTVNKLAETLRGQAFALPPREPNPAWEEASEVQVVDNGDGTFTVTVPAWLADP